MMDINDIKEKVRNSTYKISFTHTEKFRQRKIEIRELEEAIFAGQIIEEYPADPRGPSCLILGYTQGNRPLHIVCGIIREELLVITAYEPSLEEWKTDWRTRR
jgi:hypothetical protein